MNITKVNQNKITKSLNKTYEGLLAQGNGYFHVRGTFEEGLKDSEQNLLYMRNMESVTTEIPKHSLSKYGTYIPLIMGKHPELREVIINLPYFMDIKIIADNEPLDMLNSKISHFSRELNLASGELVRSLVWQTKTNCEIKLVYKRFASKADSRLFVQQVNCQVLKGSPEIIWESGIDAQVTTNGYKHEKSLDFEVSNNNISCNLTTDTNFNVYIRSLHKLESTLKIKENYDDQRCFISWEQPSPRFSFIKLTGLATSRDCEDPYNEVLKTLNNSIEHSYLHLLQASEKCWQKSWEQSRIIVYGNDEIQSKLDQAIYHLLRCNNGSEDRIQVCAKGFAGEAYYGRYFWDSEIYLLPFYLYTNPMAAKSLLMYRYHTLEGAKNNAKRYNAKGARYPWQSGLTGEEQCSLWEYSDNEIHITADIAYAIANYYNTTDDFDFLANYGLEVLIETARYWQYRVDYDEQGVPHLLNVMGPDEYSPMTKDNAYTNFLVAFHLDIVSKLANEVEKKDPALYQKVSDKTGYTKQEGADFAKLGRELPLPYDKERNLLLQCADFEEYGIIDIDDIWKDKSKPFGFFATQEKLYRSRCLKQADAVALMTLFPNSFTDEQVKTAYDYYKPLTVHDSSLSPAGHSLVAHRLNYANDTTSFLHKALAVDFTPENMGAEEGIHIANCGCIWQLFAFGFVGLSSGLFEKEMKIVPNLPKEIDKIQMPIYWKDSRYMLTVSNKEETKIEKME